jgi:uncharacterized protein with FMN-binding domain
MPRAFLALVVTVVAVVLVTNFKTTTSRLAMAPPPASAPSRSSSRSSSRATSTAKGKSSKAAVRSRTLTGAPVQQPYGTVQVAVTMKGSRITNVRPLAIPLDSGRSQEINTQAAPLLRSEVLQAQSAKIDVVSGATYTSDAYAQSLQSALDRA